MATLFSSDDEDDGDQVPPTSIHPNERYIDDNCDNDNEYDNETEFDDDVFKKPPCTAEMSFWTINPTTLSSSAISPPVRSVWKKV